MSPLPALVEGLLRPEAYPHPVRQVELRQTQMSFVFLTDDYAYKVKKPVDLGYLDYTTLELRRLYCHQEVKLNRRLCANVYLGVVPITKDWDRVLVAGGGEVIEYAVRMRRLPLDTMLDVLLATGLVSMRMIVRVASKVADFHLRARTSAAISVFGEPEAIVCNADENFAQTEKYIGITISQARYANIQSYTGAFIQKNTALFRRRVAEGRIKDCHGDLHAAHICFYGNDICIYDCVEFNERFRYCDVASEVAFLAMDIDCHGRHDLSTGLVQTYVESSQDRDLLELLNFYKCYRAYVRGKVESFKLDDHYISEAEKSKVLPIARRYFELAESYI